MKRLLVTGSRKWTDRRVILDALTMVRDAWFCDGVTLVHGDARGADRIAADIAAQWGGSAWQLEAHPADWSAPCRTECKPHHRRAKFLGAPKVCPAAGLYRNADMVALGADLCLAFILDESPGATKCARLARAAGITVRPFRAVSP